MTLFVAPRIGAYQYDGTNAAEIATAMGGWPYREENGNLVLIDPWSREHPVAPMTQYCCYGTVYPTMEALMEHYYVLPDEAPEPTP